MTHISIFWLYSGVFLVLFWGEAQLSTALCDLKIAVWGQTDVFYSSNTSPIRLGTLGSGVMVHGDGHEWWQQKSCPNHVQRQIEGNSRFEITYEILNKLSNYRYKYGKIRLKSVAICGSWFESHLHYILLVIFMVAQLSRWTCSTLFFCCKYDIPPKNQS